MPNTLVVASIPVLRHRDRRRGGPRGAGPAQEHVRPDRIGLATGQRRGGLRDRPPPPLPADHRPAALRRPRRRGHGLHRPLPRPAPGVPLPCREAEYERRLQAAYPIHPELFDRLYNDWSSLDKFQRTRGVLRLMAAVIHALWERQDASLLILPGQRADRRAAGAVRADALHGGPLGAGDREGRGRADTRSRCGWIRENPNLGRYSACRRVARTLYLGSAPTLHTANKGLEERHIKLGCVQPGETVATFGDALRRLTDGATHLYVDGKRYWFSTQPSVTRLAQDRAGQLDEDAVLEEIRQRLKKEQNTRGDFARVHACPRSSGDVPDDARGPPGDPRPQTSHVAKDQASPARKKAEEILERRGTSPRLYRNTLVFLAPDRTRLAELEQAVRQFLAWKSIEEEKETLNLDAFQAQPGQDQAGELRRDDPAAHPRDLPVAAGADPARPQGPDRVGRDPPAGAGRPGRPRLEASAERRAADHQVRRHAASAWSWTRSRCGAATTSA